MRSSSRTFIITLASLTAIAGLLTPATALVPRTALPANNAEFPKCADAGVDQMCYTNFSVDDNIDGTFDDAMSDEHLTVHTSIFDKTAQDTANLQVAFWSDGYGNLAPRLPVGSHIRIDINTRGWRPSQQGTGNGKVVYFWQEQVAGDWITHLELVTAHFSLANEDGSVFTEDSQADFFLWDSSEWGPRVLFNGMWLASNSQNFTWPPSYDANTMTWTIQTGGPALNHDGTQNLASFQAFFPDSAVINAYGADPTSLTGVFKAERLDGSKTATEVLTITRVTSPVRGILLEIPAFSFSSNSTPPLPFSARVRFNATPATFGKSVSPYAVSYKNPRHVIKPAKKLLAAPSLTSAVGGTSKATLHSTKVAGATSYQGVCTKGPKVRYGKASKTTVTVSGLTAGSWSCRVRATNKIGGKYSAAKKVTVK
jgi:hypothetical protein